MLEKDAELTANNSKLLQIYYVIDQEEEKVVRLKGGDPGIFGRLTEETDALENLHISYRVIPGISALQAATTGTGMFLTRRDVSRGFVALNPRAAAGKLAHVMLKKKLHCQ